MRIRATIFLGAALALTLGVACDSASEPGDATATPAPAVTASATASVTASPEAKPPTATPTATATATPAAPSATATATTVRPDAPVSSTPGAPIVTATAIPISGAPAVESGRSLLLAPIESVQVVRSGAGQYVVNVGTGLPGGCARYAGHTLETSGRQVVVKVYNSMPTAPTACTAIYGYTSHSVALGTLTPGTSYQVTVNDRSVTIDAQ